MTVRSAFIQGPMYDDLYARLDTFQQTSGITVEVAFQGDHPALNEHLAGLADVPYDLVSTHTKYAPSQQRFLAPLDRLLSPDELRDFVPIVLSLARIGGQLYGLPRNIDVRLLHYRTDRIDQAPATWDDLVTLVRRLNRPPDFYGFVFPGMELGLFGTFFELAEMGGASLFPDDLVPQIDNEGGRWALGLLRTLYAEGLVPSQVVDWHFDKVHDCFRFGHAAMVGDWPGYYGSYRNLHESPVANCFAVVPYPAGPTGKSLAYGGCHTFALTMRGATNPDAMALLRYLTAAPQQLIEAQNGSVPVRQSVMAQVQQAATPEEKARWQALERVINEHVLIPPKFARYPEVEEVLWRTVQYAMVGQISIPAALQSMTREIRQIVEESHA